MSSALPTVVGDHARLAGMLERCALRIVLVKPHVVSKLVLGMAEQPKDPTALVPGHAKGELARRVLVPGTNND